MKSVLIVGAGPAGLVTAKTLLHRNGAPFKVTIFESAERPGGMWRARKDETGDKCSPEMRTNLTRFTVAFADLSWHSVKLGDSNDHAAPCPPPLFPKAYQVGQYLREYANRFIPADDVIFCNREVVAAKLVEEGGRKWSVSSLDKSSRNTYKDDFDYLIVASGFFDRPMAKFGVLEGSRPPSTALHSSRFRHISSLTSKSGNMVIIGGGISGSEAAATAAFQISNAKYSPGQPKAAWADSKVYHVFDRPFYTLPRYVPKNPYNPAIQDYNLDPEFLPGDLVLYNLSRRGTGTISASNGPVPPDKAGKGHDFLRSLVGGDQRDLGHPEVVYKPHQMQYPAFTGITDTYAEFLRSGLIVPIQGRAEEMSSVEGVQSVRVAQKGFWAGSPDVENECSIDNVTAVIEATGYQVHLDYLSEEVRESLGYDSSNARIPFLLSRGSVMNPAVPELAFTGFYEGPYWGVMEMQARIIAQIWDPQPSSPETASSLSAMTTSIEETRASREAIARRDLSVPQFWMADYIGLMEELSRLAGVSRNDASFENQQTGPTFPARYSAPETDTKAVNEVITEIRSLIDASERDARFVAAAAFRGMQGSWTLQRKIDSRHPSSPGGVLKGTAEFHPREPTDATFSAEYLYIEQGTFTMDTGFSFPATRRYVYRYSEASDRIYTYFVQEDSESAERLFNDLGFETKNSGEGADAHKGWIAKSHHWCSPDTYKTSCEFRFRGASLKELGIVYEVSGPNKDYRHESWYERPALG